MCIQHLITRREITEEFWQRVPLFHGGYFDTRYSLWSRGPINRTLEDAAAVISPTLYRRFVQPLDHMLAGHLPAASFIHIPASMFLLEACLEIEEIKCLEINNDVFGPPLERTVPHFQRVQTARQPLRGDMTPKPAYEVLMSLVKGRWWTRTEARV